MITKVSTKYFKKFDEQVFDLSENTVLAGPNNSGKTTLFQAIVVWNLALKKWLQERSLGTQKAITISRKDFTAIPLREMKLLWTDTITHLRRHERGDKAQGTPRVMSITLEGSEPLEKWKLTFEFTYSSSEQIFVKPTSFDGNEAIPQMLQAIEIVHIPPFSGINAEETRFDRAYQDLLIGQGKAGDILRNLLLEVSGNEDNWLQLVRQIEDLFRYRLLPPEYDGRPFIVAEYVKGIPEGPGKGGFAQLDIATAGSGFLQTLLLLAFVYARPASLILVDEPDAHLHVVLQRHVFGKLRDVCFQKKSQLIVATHSEVLLEETEPTGILSFYGKPHRLLSGGETDQVRQALKHLTSLDLLLAEDAKGVLYLESRADFDLLKAWSQVLEHPIHNWFEEKPFWQPIHSRNPKHAREHFFALKAVCPKLNSILLLDGDSKEIDEHEFRSEELNILRWKRYEAENYLMVPPALERFGVKYSPLFTTAAMAYLREEMPSKVFENPLAEHEFLNNVKVSKTILPEFFSRAQIKLEKRDYYLVAKEMNKEEIHPEIAQKLDALFKRVREGAL